MHGTMHCIASDTLASNGNSMAKIHRFSPKARVSSCNTSDAMTSLLDNVIVPRMLRTKPLVWGWVFPTRQLAGGRRMDTQN